MQADETDVGLSNSELPLASRGSIQPHASSCRLPSSSRLLTTASPRRQADISLDFISQNLSTTTTRTRILTPTSTYTNRLSTTLELGHLPPLHVPPKVICNPSLQKQIKLLLHLHLLILLHQPPSMDTVAIMTCRTLCGLTQVSSGETLSRRRVATIATRHHPAAPRAKTEPQWILSD